MFRIDSSSPAQRTNIISLAPRTLRGSFCQSVVALQCEVVLARAAEVAQLDHFFEE